MGKTHAIYHRDNRSPRKGDRAKNLDKQLKNIEAKLSAGLITEKWAEDARGKIKARAKRYQVTLNSK